MNKIIHPQEFDFEWFSKIKIQKRSKGNQGSKQKISYKDIITAFDIETTRIKEIEQSVMYIWQWQFGTEYTVIGRTWTEFIEFKNAITDTLQEGETLCIFVHNLSYEFQFLRGIYSFQVEEVFALKARKILKCKMSDKLEFRCSYLHCNMGLAMYTDKMGAEHAKLSGIEFNYSIQRFSWTELTQKEIEYVVNDVLGLVEAIQIEMQHDKDSLYTFPLTSTGYVRRDAKKAMRLVSHTYVKSQLVDYNTYQMCKEAFRGGNTHANRFYSGIVVKNVQSADRSSSYPDVLCNCLFPVSAFYHAGIVPYEELLNLINVRKKAVLMRISITNLRLRDKYWGCPYLSKDKSRNIYNGLYDNGRILSADYLETTMTDIDFRIILDEYEFDDLTTFDVSYARYGKLPPSLIDMNIKYYKGKTELKNVEGEELFYMKSKNKLNSIYGMMAQDPVKQSIDFLEGEFIEHKDNPEELLDNYNARAFLCYQWGVWTTAWARYRLEEGIKLAGDNFIYCDTDSVKYINEIDWTSYNNDRIKDSKKSGSFATDPVGLTHYMGVYEHEGNYEEFITLGAKKYCYSENGKLSLTVSGVSKKEGAKELQEHGGIQAFKQGFIFIKAGGIEAVYNNEPLIKTYTVEGKEIVITSNVVLRESTYTLGITAEYERLLQLSKEDIDDL